MQPESDHSEQKSSEKTPESPLEEVRNEPSDTTVTHRFHKDSSPPAHDRRQFTVFQVDDFTFQPTTPRTTHWSVPWSDLMMTMFLLFLIMFVYQAAHKELLVNEQTEVVGGETTKAVEMAPAGKPSIPYVPIKPSLPLITGGTIKKVVPVHIEDLTGTRFLPGKNGSPIERIKKSLTTPSPTKPQASPSGSAIRQETGLLSNREKPKPLLASGSEVVTSKNERLNRLLGTIRSTIIRYHLDDYASVGLISTKKLRVILKTDLFFDPGKADLTRHSMRTLEEIGAAIRNTPYMIDVVGHTDNVPPRSKLFSSNWDLSVARASAMARFFIEEMDMNPDQFAVSGYASYRPLYPNTNAENRAANRRVEIIIGTSFPQSETFNKNDTLEKVKKDKLKNNKSTAFDAEPSTSKIFSEPTKKK